MVGRLSEVLLLAGAGIASASASAHLCRNVTFPLYAEGQNGVFNLSIPQTQTELSAFFLNANQQGNNYTAQILEGYTTTSGIFNISATYCEPKSGPSSTLQILQHGLGFDRTYWNYPYNNYNYSYTNLALAQGYSTFAFDLLGFGNSTKADPLNDVQGDLLVGVLKAVTDIINNGTIPGIGPRKFEKVVHVGHSLGSLLVYALTARNPNITDGIIFTGFAQNGSFVALLAASINAGIANTVAPRFDGYPNCYFTEVTPVGQLLTLLGPSNWDTNIVDYLFENNQPVTCGIRLTLGGIAGTLNGFKGPVLILTGERDIPFCGGNCYAPPTGYPNLPSFTQHLMPNVSSFQAQVINNTGHAMNIHYSAPTTYGMMFDWFTAQNFTPQAVPHHHHSG